MKGHVFKRCQCIAQYDAKGRRKNCKKAHGSWYYAADTGIEKNGKRQQLKKGGVATADEAERELSTVLARISEGSYTHDDGQTVERWLKKWMELKERAGRRPTTLRSYRHHIDNYLVPHLGRIRLRDLRPSHVDKLLAEVNDGKRKTATVRRIHATLRSALTTAVKQQLITFNMAKNVELPTSQRPKVIPWEPVELGAFLDHIGTHRLGALFEVIAGTGLRRGRRAGSDGTTSTSLGG
ncbi:Arm DNA-binding domain-containing protein [Streptomyces subrutilus]|uniref:phage integrase central domain-containing protein n=1 Tax=Streptomyces subrutilus TaxID=36818 RepID=UPI00341B5AE4